MVIFCPRAKSLVSFMSTLTCKKDPPSGIIYIHIHIQNLTYGIPYQFAIVYLVTYLIGRPWSWIQECSESNSVWVNNLLPSRACNANYALSNNHGFPEITLCCFASVENVITKRFFPTSFKEAARLSF